MLPMKIILLVFMSATICKLSVTRRKQDKTDTFNPERERYSKRLIQTNETSLNWLTEIEVEGLIRDKVKFMDVTHYQWLDFVSKPTEKHEYPKQVKYQELLGKAFGNIQKSSIIENLEKLTSFFNRHYKSKSGRDASTWIYLAAQSMIKNSSVSDVSVEKFEHSWSQFSVVVKFKGATEKAPSVILSSHMDSTGLYIGNEGIIVAGFFGEFNRAPGADDDGSGTVTVLEVLRLFISLDLQFERSVEFHFYSAEEGGLLGSQAISTSYLKKKVDVYGAFQIDMDGYTGKQNVIGIITDYTDQKLTTFLKLIASEYCELETVDTKCGYACSDHASWNKLGYPSVFAIESEFKQSSPFIHSDEDTIENIDFDHIVEFVKLALAFVVELSEPLNLE